MNSFLPTSNRTRAIMRVWGRDLTSATPTSLNAILKCFLECVERPWNTSARNEISYWLEKSGFFAYNRMSRAPEALGFIKLLRGSALEVTEAGRELMQDRELEDLFLRQLLKWQYPSPNHNGRDYQELFSIRPFLETLRLVRELNGLSKTEIALFALPLIDFNNFDETRAGIEEFRVEFSQRAPGIERETWLRGFIEARVGHIYRDDIVAGRVGTREGGDVEGALATLIRKKSGNLNDYADSAMRYFLATGLFTFSSSGRLYRLSLLPERVAEVDTLLQDTRREPVAFANSTAFITDYLGNARLPVLPSDAAPPLRERIRVLAAQSPQQVRREWGIKPKQIRSEKDPIVLKSWARRLSKLAEAEATATQQIALQTPRAVDEIVEMFVQIRQNKVPERPLFMEWNVWRVMSALDDGKIINNFEIDRFGQPRKGAPGGMADIQCEYSGFHLSVEVTLSTGATQYRMEGEPVNRHVGLLQKAARDRSDTRPVYGLFIADRLNASVITHFYGLHYVKTKEFAGAVSVIPLELNVFLLMLQSAQSHLPIQASYLQDFLSKSKAAALQSEDEEQWYSIIKSLAGQWIPPAAL